MFQMFTHNSSFCLLFCLTIRSLFFLCTCVWCMCMYMSMHSCPWPWMFRLEEDLGVLLCRPASLSLADSLTEPVLLFLTNSRINPPVSAPPAHFPLDFYVSTCLEVPIPVLVGSGDFIMSTCKSVWSTTSRPVRPVRFIICSDQVCLGL